MILASLIGVGALLVLSLLVAFAFRRVVPANEVHIVQSTKKTTSYGKDLPSGNVYYQFPSFLPFLGIERVKLPVSVFDLSFDGYKAYDKDKVPFEVDITAFFRIANSDVAAQKISTIDELEQQLRSVVQGAVRTTLAKSDIEQIMLDRAVFGEQFTKEVATELQSWGVETVKSIELMDIRDAEGSEVIDNIQAKKKSSIEMESRKEVANNKREAEMAEIEARKEVGLKDQEAQELVGKRTVESQQAVELANEAKLQTVKEQQKLTKEKEMAVLHMETIKAAEISKEATIVKQNESKESRVIQAEADLAVQQKQKESKIVQSEGLLKAKENEAKGIEAEGAAKATAKKEMELAPVAAQVALAREIGGNEGYQEYLIKIKNMEVLEEVGKKQAEALTQAEIKIISNTESPTSGLSGVMDLFSSKGGIQAGAMLEGLSNTDLGSKLLKKVVGEDESIPSGVEIEKLSAPLKKSE